MADQFWGASWLNENEQRAYPLLVGTDRSDTTGTFRLPDSFLVEIFLPIHSGLAVESSRFFLRRVASLPSGFALAIGYDDGTSSPPIVATATMARVACTEFAVFALVGVGDFADVTGRVVLGLVAEIDQQPAGEFLFTPVAGALDPDCVRPVPQGVSSIAIVSGDNRSPRYYGDIEAVAGNNIALSITSAGIRIDAVAGAGLTAECDCPGSQTLAVPIRTINGISPDANGAFTLVGDDCLSVETIAGGFRLRDRCSAPCCGSAELKALAADLEHFGTEATALQNFVSRLDSLANQFGAVVLSSRLNDSACAT